MELYFFTMACLLLFHTERTLVLCGCVNHSKVEHMFYIQSLGIALATVSYKILNKFDCTFLANIEDFLQKCNQALAFSKRNNLKTF